MHKRNKMKAIIAISVAMAFVMPVAAFANVGTFGVTSDSENTVDMENMVESTTNSNSDTIDNNYNLDTEDTIVQDIVDTTGITIYVDDDAVPPYDGTPEHPYRYIQDGIDNATAGDTIYVLNGTYYENVLVTKQLDMVGESRENVIVDGSGGSDTFKVSAENVNISTFSVTNSTRGFQIRNLASYCTVTDCDVYNNSGYGFYMVTALNCNIINCDIYNSGIVILAYWADAATVTDCNMYDNSKGGIHLAHLTGWTLKNNNIYNTFAPLGIRTQDWLVEQFRHDIDASNTIDGEPIYYLIGQSDMVLDETDVFSYIGLVDCTNITVKNSDVQGILLANTTDSTFFNVTTHDAHTGIYQFESSGNSFTNCDSYDNAAMGIQFQHSPNNDIINCDVYNNADMGIRLFYGENSNIINCDSYNNDNGIDIRSSPDSNIINCNTYNNVGTGVYDDHGIFVDRSANVNVTNCNSYSNSFYGIRLLYADNSNVLNCNFYNNDDYGCMLYYSQGTILRNNTINDNGREFGIGGTYILDVDASNTINGRPIYYLIGHSNKTLDETLNFGFLGLIDCTNITAKNADVCGIVLMGTSYSTLSNVDSHNGIFTITDCSYINFTDCAAYDSEGSGISLTSSNYCNFIRCTVHDISGVRMSAGFHLYRSSNNNFINCISYNNKVGILFRSTSNFNYVINCSIFDNSAKGINVVGFPPPPPATNQMYHNIFVNNAQGNANDPGSNIYDNGYPSGGNYWSDYTGVDEYSGPGQNISGSDGIGDTPYNIPGGSNQDRYPLMEPIDTLPPIITEVKATPELQTITDPVNITCNVIDNVEVDTVKINITGPEGFTLEATMEEGSYYYEDTYTTMGVYSYFIWANDIQLNTAVSDTYTFTITDLDLPISNVNLLPAWETAVPFTVTATASDNTGVATVTLWSRYSSNGIDWTDWTSYGIDEAEPWEWEFTGSDGYYEFYSIAVDDYANVEDTPSTADTSTGLDTVLPVTTIILDGTMGENGWYVSCVIVTLSPSDSLSGIDSTWYNLDSGYWKLYTVPFTVCSEGQHTVEYYSFDRAGNREDTKSVDFKIDKIPPVTEHEFDGIIGKEGWFVSDVTITISATDATSGVNYTKYKLDSGEWTPYVDPFDVTENGDHTLYYYSVDLAGNTEPTNEVDFKILHDIVPPVTTHEFDGTIGDNDWYTTNVVVTLIAEDDSSGVDYTMYKLDDGAWEGYTGPFLVTEDGEHTIEYYSVDRVENKEVDKGPFDFKIDQTNPTIDLKAEKIGLTKWLLTATVSDETSGVAKVEFYLAGGLLGVVTEPPYEWEVSNPKKGDKAQAIVYDNAGNEAISEEVNAVSQSHSQSQSNSLTSVQISTLSNPQPNLDVGRVWLRGLLFRCTRVGNVNHAMAIRLHYIEFTPSERTTGAVTMNNVIFKDSAYLGRMYEMGAGLFTYVIGFFEGGLEIL